MIPDAGPVAVCNELCCAFLYEELRVDDSFLLQETPGDHKPQRRLLRVMIVVSLPLLAAVAIAAEVQPFTWSKAFLLSPASLEVGTATGYRLSAVSCGSPSMCVAVDTEGDALASTEPSIGGDAWSPTKIDSAALLGVACPVDDLCVAGDAEGHILTSTNPGASGPTWSTGGPPAAAIESMACSGGSLCIAVDAVGDLLSSTNPFAGPSTWHSVHLDPVGAPLNSVSCPSSSLCVAVDDAGHVFSSTNPSGPASSWQAAAIDEEHPLAAISCPTTAFCLILDFESNVFVSTDPTGPASTWTAAGNTGHSPPQSLSCPSSDRCLSVQPDSTAVSDDPGSPESWLSTTFSDTDRLDAIACPVVTFCVAVDSTGHALTGVAPPPAGTLQLSLAGTGEGTVASAQLSCSASCSNVYPRSTPLTLTAAPAAGSSFVGWGGPCVGTAPCTLTVQRITNLTATFARLPPPAGFTLTISIGGSGTVSGPGISCPPKCRATLAPGVGATLSATPAPGWHFVRWGGTCTSRGACTVRATKDDSVDATFERNGNALIRIVRVSVSARSRTATIVFHATRGHPRTLCTLRDLGRPAHVHYRACHSPRIYRRLRAGRYMFLVTDGSHLQTPVTRPFTIR